MARGVGDSGGPLPRPAEASTGGERAAGGSAPSAVDSPFAVNDRVVHRVTPDSVTVLFETVGYRTLETEVVKDRLLTRSA